MAGSKNDIRGPVKLEIAGQRQQGQKRWSYHNVCFDVTGTLEAMTIAEVVKVERDPSGVANSCHMIGIKVFVM